MLNICDLPVVNIKVENDGYDEYLVHFFICPSESENRWVQMGNSYMGCRSFGACMCGDPIKFKSAKVAVLFIKEEYGSYGLSILVDKDFNKPNLDKFLSEV